MSPSPGTVSKILWHFTGGPLWNSEKNRQEPHPKSASLAFDALVGILKSQELRIGQYKEVVKIKVRRRRTDPKTKAKTTEESIEEMRSEPVCCLADIPIAHLSYHAQRYGKFAIGFHRDVAIAAGFNPVLYTLHHSSVIRSIYEGFAQFGHIDYDCINQAAHLIETATEDIECDRGHEVDVDLSFGLGELKWAADEIRDGVSEVEDSFKRFLAFVKTFDLDEFGTIYCEREWRSVFPFKFKSEEAIAMVIVPKEVDARRYYEEFMQIGRARLKLRKHIPINAWEVLIEH